VLSWYPGVNLDQLENLCEGGLAGLDRTKLRRRACAIAACAETDALFGAGDSDESLGGMDFEEPSSAEESISLVTPFHHPLVVMILSWPLTLATLLRWSRLARQAPPDCIRIFLYVFMYAELMSCPATFRSHVLMTLHPEFPTHWLLVVCEPDLT
jgi:hypothetical protein